MDTKIDIKTIRFFDKWNIRKIAVPGQVAVMGVDNSKYCDICYPKLTSLNNRLVEMSLEAARILLDSLEGRENPDRIMLFSRIVEREST